MRALLISMTFYLLTPLALAEAQPTVAVDKEAGRDSFKQGKTAYEAGEYRAALSFFEDSYAESGKPELLFNIGQTKDKMRDDEGAIEAFEDFMEQVPDTSRRTELEARLRLLRKNVDAKYALQEEAQEKRSIAKSPWLWIGVAVVIAGAVTAALLIRRSNQLDPGDLDEAITLWTF